MKRRERELAETLYVESQLTHDEIADRLKVAPRTVRYWDQKDDWSKKRKAFIAARSSSAESLQSLINGLAKEIEADRKAKRKPSTSRFNAVTGLQKQLAKLRQEGIDQVDKLPEEPPAKKKPPLTKENFLKIERETFGLYADAHRR